MKFLHSEDEEVLEYEEGIGKNLTNLCCQIHFISLYVYIYFCAMLYMELIFFGGGNVPIVYKKKNYINGYFMV